MKSLLQFLLITVGILCQCFQVRGQGPDNDSTAQDSGSDLSTVEAVTTNSPLTTSQETLFITTNPEVTNRTNSQNTLSNLAASESLTTDTETTRWSVSNTTSSEIVYSTTLEDLITNETAPESGGSSTQDTTITNLTSENPEETSIGPIWNHTEADAGQTTLLDEATRITNAGNESTTASEVFASTTEILSSPGSFQAAVSNQIESVSISSLPEDETIVRIGTSLTESSNSTSSAIGTPTESASKAFFTETGSYDPTFTSQEDTARPNSIYSSSDEFTTISLFTNGSNDEFGFENTTLSSSETDRVNPSSRSRKDFNLMAKLEFQVIVVASIFGAITFLLIICIAALFFFIMRLKRQIERQHFQSADEDNLYLNQNSLGPIDQLHAYDNSAFKSGQEMAEKCPDSRREIERMGYEVFSGKRVSESSVLPRLEQSENPESQHLRLKESVTPMGPVNDNK